LPSEGIEISENEIKADVLNKLILNQLVTQLAEKYGVRVEQSEIDFEIDNIKSHLTDGVSLDDKLKTMYGIKQDKFVEKSLEPEILYVKLHEKYLSDEGIDAEAKMANNDQEYRAQSILDRLKGGEDFSAVAKEVSDDEITKEYGGDLGFFGRGEMVPEFEEAAFGLEVGQISDVIKTDYGYHIVKTTDKKVLENDEEQVKASHILLKTADGYEDWISKNLQNSQVYVFVRGLKWEDGKVMIK
jgi:foldase protein PrsA